MGSSLHYCPHSLIRLFPSNDPKHNLCSGAMSQGSVLERTECTTVALFCQQWLDLAWMCSRTGEPYGTSMGRLPGLSRCAVNAEGLNCRCQQSKVYKDSTRTANLHLKHYFLCRFVLVCRFALCIVIIFVSLWYILKIVLKYVMFWE